MDPALPSAPLAARPVIVVLGSGRSGTSLLMQALAALGMTVSDRLIGAAHANPQGHYEDAPIVRLQADLLRQLGAWPYHPLPAHWLEHPATAAAEQALATVLAERLARAPGPGPWGFKDPRTAAFLPLWQRLFVRLGVTPRYVLALRDPGSIVQSFMAAYGSDAQDAEAVWLRRTVEALRHTGARCHLVHYEDWFARPRAVATGLARFAGLPGHALPERLIRPDLDRARAAALPLRTPQARALAQVLAACRGDDFDPDALLAQVNASGLA